MSELENCERDGCRSIEKRGRGWWGVTLVDGEAKVRPYEPGTMRRTGERFVCGEGCMSREIANWATREQRRQAERRRQELEVAALENMMRQA